MANMNTGNPEQEYISLAYIYANISVTHTHTHTHTQSLTILQVCEVTNVKCKASYYRVSINLSPVFVTLLLRDHCSFVRSDITIFSIVPSNKINAYLADRLPKQEKGL